MTKLSTRTATTGLLTIGALQVLGATGSPWPLSSRQELSDAVARRGALGLAGRTDIVSPGSVSERFRRLDRRCYSPLCLALAALAVPAVSGSAR